MKQTNLVFWLLVLVTASSAQQAVTHASIEGNVVDAVTGVPLKDTRLTLFTATGVNPVGEARADEKGNFAFNDVTPGRYHLQAERTSYLTQKYGEIAFGLPAPPVTVASGQRFTVTLRLVRAATLMGLVYDNDRRPLPDARVQLLVVQYDLLGRKFLNRLTTVPPAPTDSDGTYLISGVPPGDYYIRAAPGNLPPQTPGTFVIQENNALQTYYPGVTNPDEAIALHVVGGTELRAVDFNLPRSTTYKVSGRIVNPFATSDRPPYEYYLVRRNPRLRDRDSVVPDQNSASDEFEFHSVLPGSYELFIGFHTGDPRSEPEALIYTGRSSVDIVDRDVSDLVVAIDGGIDVEGAIGLEREIAVNPQELTRIQPLLMTTGEMPGILGPTAVLARRPFVQTDGKFRLPHAAAGRYQLVMPLSGSLRNSYISAARLGSLDILGRIFEITGDNPGPLVIEISNQGGTLQGTVLNRNDEPIAGAHILMVPPINFIQDHDAYRNTISDQTGRFTISGIRPGLYTAFAFSKRLPANAAMNADFMTKYLAYGTSVSVEKGNSVYHNLSLISVIE